nr:MAG TPA: hypothetical protein [Caudoviricetes sp.]
MRQAEALGRIIAFIISLIFYALQMILDIITLGIILYYFEGLHRYIPLYSI